MKIFISRRRKRVDDPKIILNSVNFNQVEWYRPYSINDGRLIGIKGDLYFWNYDGFDPLKKDLTQNEIDEHEFVPSGSFMEEKYKIQK